jgi:hypothetical protein
MGVLRPTFSVAQSSQAGSQRDIPLAHNDGRSRTQGASADSGRTSLGWLVLRRSVGDQLSDYPVRSQWRPVDLGGRYRAHSR